MANTLWFKAEYVIPILTGKKTYTDRKPTKINRERSGIIHASVGPRTPFAALEVTRVDIIDIAHLPERRERSELKKLYPYEARIARISFRFLYAYDNPEIRALILDDALDLDSAARISLTLRPLPTGIVLSSR